MPSRRGPSIEGMRFGPNGQLEVLRKSEVQDVHNNTVWDVKCHECAKDPELFGDAEYRQLRGNINRGVLSCGCAGSPRWTEQQYITKLQRHCKGSTLHFVGFLGECTGNTTKIILECTRHRLSFQSTISEVLGVGRDCPECIRGARFTADENLIQRFMSTGKFKLGTKFWRDPDASKSSLMWFMQCPKCSFDSFVQSRLCDGVFKSKTYSLELGHLPCRCSHTTVLSKEHQEFDLRRTLQNNGLSFIQWEGEYTTLDTKFTFNCPKHGDRTQTVKSFKLNKHACLSCAKVGFDVNKEGHLYILRISGFSDSFTGYGITGNLEKRLKDHRRNLSKQGYFVDEVKVFSGLGLDIRNAERSVIEEFPMNSRPISGFRTEATHQYLFDDVVSFVQQELCPYPPIPQHPSQQPHYLH